MNWLNTKLIISALILAKLSLVSTEKGTVHKLRKLFWNKEWKTADFAVQNCKLIKFDFENIWFLDPCQVFTVSQ